MSRTRHPHRISRSHLISVAALAALLVPFVATPASGADDDVVIVPTTIDIGTTSGLATTIDIDSDGAIFVTQPAGEYIEPQCFPVQGSIVTCIGAPSASDPLEQQGIAGLSDFLPAESGDHVAALGWMVPEAIDAIAALYDVPRDGRIERYAGDQIRAYIVSRVLDIFDRFLYGIALTPNEQKTYDYFTAQFLEIDRAIANYAKQEYTEYLASPCTYRPPAAPSFVADAVLLPEAVQSWCSRPQTQWDTIFVFAPPIPSADEFQAWGMYRHASDLGLDALASDTVTRNLAGSQNAMYQFGALGAVAGTAAAGTVAGLVAGLSATVGTSVAGAIGSAAGATSWVAGVGPVVTGSVSTVASIAAASVVAIVVVAIIVTAVAIVQIVAYEEVGATVNKRLANAQASDDPFGLADIIDDFAGLELRENMSADNLPEYRSANSVSRILSTVVTVTSARYGGVYVPDTATLWADNATTPDDFAFFVTDSAGSRVQESIVIPIEGVDTTVRFSRGWLVTDGGTGERAALAFPFVTVDGESALAMRSAIEPGAFTVSVLTDAGSFEESTVDTIEYLDASGDLVRVALAGESTSGLAGPMPSVVGPLTPGRTAILRPNPVDEAGTFELDRYATGYDYTWDVVRADPETGDWTEVASYDGYDARFIPTEIGSYRASVLMHDTDPSDGVDDDVWGFVDFAVSPPTIDVAILDFQDDGTDQLRVVAQVRADVPENDYTLTVEWPGTVTGAESVSSSVDLQCHRIDAMSCSTVLTSSFPDLDSALSHELPHDAALGQGVDVTITDRFGSASTQHFAIDEPARPTFQAPRVAPAVDQPGEVLFDVQSTTIQVPIGYASDPNYEIARIVPGGGQWPTTFGLVDPEDDLPYSSLELPGGGATASIVYDDDLDEWYINVRVTADASDVGTRVIPLVVQQVTGARSTLPITLDLLPATDGRYRGAVVSTVAPESMTVEAVPDVVPFVMGGKAEWGEYGSTLCVRVQYTEFPSAPVQHCAPVTEFLDGEGAFAAIDFREFLPEGLQAGRYEVAASVPEGDRSDGTELITSFRMAYGPPIIENLQWTASERSVTFEAVPADPAVPIVTRSCFLDGAAIACTAAAAGTWPAGLTAGLHTFAVDVEDAGGNYASESIDFTVDEAVDPGEVDVIVTINVPVIEAGWSVELNGAGFEAGEAVRIELHSTPIVLTRTTADEVGEVSAVVTIPEDTPPGIHEIVLIGETSGAEARVELEVTPSAPGQGPGGLAVTGSTVLLGLGLVGALLVIGGIAVGIRRRRVGDGISS